MTFKTLENVAIRRITSVVPDCTIDNLDVPDEIQKARKRLVRNIGIRYRRICAIGQIFTDLGQYACEKTLDFLKWEPSSIDALIMVTQSSEYIIPSTSIILQNRLNFKEKCLAFDINLGCSGFPYGIMTGASLIDGINIKRMLLVIGDQSASNGATDQGREILFGDACSVVALEHDTKAQKIFFEGFSDGSGAKSIYIPEGGKRSPLNKESQIPKLRNDGVVKAGTDVWLNGPQILTFSTTKPIDAIYSILEQSGISKNEIYRFYFHQANMIINKTINKKLSLTDIESPSSLYYYGNTSSTSIPITMSQDIDSFKKEKQNILLCGFGIGLSWATMIIKLSIEQVSSIKIVPKDYISK